MKQFFNRPTRVEKGFTLVEMLVVIAVIAILAALIFPVLYSAQERARLTFCKNNIRQIGQNLLMYAGDSGDRAPSNAWPSNSSSLCFPNTTAFRKLIENGAVSNLFRCPSDRFYYAYLTNDPGYERIPKPLWATAAYRYSSYGFNGGVLTGFGTNSPSIAGRRLNSIKEPARTVLSAELPSFFPYSWHKPKGPSWKEPGQFYDAMNVVGFVDGHIGYIRIYWDDIRRGDFALNYDPPSSYDYRWSGD